MGQKQHEPHMTELNTSASDILFEANEVLGSPHLNPYKLLAEHMVDTVWLYDFELKKLIYVSPSITRLLGYTPDEVLAMSLNALFVKASYDIFERGLKERHAKFLEGHRSDDVLLGLNEVTQIHKNGDFIQVEISTKYLYSESDDRHFILGVGRDVAERLELMQHLSREVEEKNAAIALLEAKEAELKHLTELLIEKNETLKVLAGTDDLTCLYNRYYLDRRIMAEIERSERYHQPLSLILFDLDHFKRVNDTWGHATGDAVLVAIADQVTQIIRYPDILARWGGEEFAVLLPQTGLKGATLVAEKIRKHLEKFEHPGVGIVTSSFGVASLKTDERWESWFKRVDLALYQAKAEGRNRVIANDDFLTTPLTYVKMDWNASWNSGHEQLDLQHQELLAYVNVLLEKHLSVESTPLELEEIDTLINHLKRHFEDEEFLQKQWDFPEMANHKDSHRQLIRRIESFKYEYMNHQTEPSSFFTFIMDEVVMGHLLTEDIRYYPYIFHTVTD